MKFKKLCLANGDEYSNGVTINDSPINLLDTEFITITSGKNKILINPEFIVSIEVGESNKLNVI